MGSRGKAPGLACLRHSVPAPVMMRVLGVVGWSGSGKTTLLEALIPLLRGSGVRVSTIKHAHHRVDPDQVGKDSFRHRVAGAEEVVLANAARFVIFHENRGGAEPDLAALLARMAKVDLVLVEGFKGEALPKIEIFRPAVGKPPIWPGMADIIAVASDGMVADCHLPVLDLNDPASICGFILRWLEQQPQAGA
ncbi:MAG TPA: molybdopterin-guanine dinucleotide biosynthesis protein B [Acetobacteraceae bacterium]|nr:molybdopterin-guanine dinucleotide biosynthesis protein B [Acetobacteraceae bacterium]